ncbi:hypothetical protein V2J09_002942 [Rumex salicifolius]
MKDLLTQEGLQKALLEEKLDSIKKEYWDEMQEKTASIIPLCLGDEVTYQMSESSDLVQHVNTFNHIIGDLGRVGVKVDDKDHDFVVFVNPNL